MVCSHLFCHNQITITGSDERLISIDTISLNQFNSEINQVIIFSHGFKGFKDWGPFNEIAKYFAKSGYVFVKFNFSHNGTSIGDPQNFVDLDAFGNNNFSKELNDLGFVIDWVYDRFKSNLFNKTLLKNRYQFRNPEIFLLGHSRGGSISILKSAEDKRISAVISWASPSDLLSKVLLNEKINKWKKTNVSFIYNSRTKQNMPLYYQFFEDCLKNKERLDIRLALERIQIPHLQIHGDLDAIVSVESAYIMKQWSPNTFLHIIKSADHVFSACHPYTLKEFPKNLKEALVTTLFFLNDL